MALAGFEYFGKVTEKGYRPAVAPGLAACVAAPLVAYWVGEAALPLVIAFAFIAGAIGFIGAAGRRVRPAAEHGGHDDGRGLDRPPRLVRRADPCVVATSAAATNIGTDTLFLIALGVVVNDIGALLRRLGRRPDAAAGVDQPEQDGRGPDRRHAR